MAATALMARVECTTAYMEIGAVADEKWSAEGNFRYYIGVYCASLFLIVEVRSKTCKQSAPLLSELSIPWLLR
jgi:hypothetical protein